jgi:hypothetical protein
VRSLHGGHPAATTRISMVPVQVGSFRDGSRFCDKNDEFARNASIVVLLRKRGERESNFYYYHQVVLHDRHCQGASIGRRIRQVDSKRRKGGAEVHSKVRHFSPW